MLTKPSLRLTLTLLLSSGTRADRALDYSIDQQDISNNRSVSRAIRSHSYTGSSGFSITNPFTPDCFAETGVRLEPFPDGVGSKCTASEHEECDSKVPGSNCVAKGGVKWCDCGEHDGEQACYTGDQRGGAKAQLKEHGCLTKNEAKKLYCEESLEKQTSMVQECKRIHWYHRDWCFAQVEMGIALEPIRDVELKTCWEKFKTEFCAASEEAGEFKQRCFEEDVGGFKDAFMEGQKYCCKVQKQGDLDVKVANETAVACSWDIPRLRSSRQCLEIQQCTEYTRQSDGHFKDAKVFYNPVVRLAKECYSEAEGWTIDGS